MAAASLDPTDEETYLRQRLAVLEQKRLQGEKHKRQQVNPPDVPSPTLRQPLAKEAQSDDLPCDDDTFEGPSIMRVEELTELDKTCLEDLLLKQWGIYHPKYSVPYESWKSQWYAALSNDEWNTNVKPIKPELQRYPRDKIVIPIEGMQYMLNDLEYFDSVELEIVSMYNRSMIYYLAQTRIRYWVHERSHHRIPTEPDFIPVEPRRSLIRLHEMAGQIEEFVRKQRGVERCLQDDFVGWNQGWWKHDRCHWGHGWRAGDFYTSTQAEE
jgi:hypothetical protein